MDCNGTQNRKQPERSMYGAGIVENCSNSTDIYIRYDANYGWKFGAHMASHVRENKANVKERKRRRIESG